MARLSMSIWAVAFFLAVSARALPVQQADGQDQMMDPWMEFEAHALSSSSHMMDEINDDIDQKTKELQEAHDGDHGKDELYGTQGSHESDNKQKLPEIPPTPEEVAKAHHKQDGEDDDSEEQKPSKDNDKKADGPVDVHVEKPHHDEDAETPAPKPEDKPEEKPKEEKPTEEPAEKPAEEHKEEKPHSAIPSPTSTPTPTVTPSPTAAAVPTPTPTKKGLLGSLPIAGNLLGKLGL